MTVRGSAAADGQALSATHVVQFSTGIGSAEVLRRVVDLHGTADTVALSADTLIEDHDNWRFAREVIRHLRVPWVVLADGRTPTSRTMLGKDVAILRDRRGGVTRPLTLRAFREQLESYPTLFDQDDWGACNCMDGAA